MARYSPSATGGATSAAAVSVDRSSAAETPPALWRTGVLKTVGRATGGGWRTVRRPFHAFAAR